MSTQLHDCPGCGVPLWNTQDLCMRCVGAIDWLTYFLLWASGTLTEKQIHQRIRRLRRMNVLAGHAAKSKDPMDWLEHNAEFNELLRQELALGTSLEKP